MGRCRSLDTRRQVPPQARDRYDDARRSKARAASAVPGFHLYNRSDGFQLGLDFLRLVRLGLRAIGWRARPQAVNHRLGLLALADLRPCPLQEESFLAAHGVLLR